MTNLLEPLSPEVNDPWPDESTKVGRVRRSFDALRTMDPHRRNPILFSFILFLAAALLAGFYALWAYDVHNSEVVRDVTLAGHDVSGLDRTKLQSVVESIAKDYQSSPVRIITTQGAIDTTAGALGLSVDEQATIASALAIGHRGPIIERPFRWAGSILGADHVATVQLLLDPTAADTTIRQLEGEGRLEPVEPSVVLNDNGVFIMKPGVVGTGVDIPALLAAIPRSVALPAGAKSGPPLTVTAKTQTLHPKFPDSAAAALAAQANDLATTKITIQVGKTELTMNPKRVRSWLLPVTGPDAFSLGVNGDLIETDLNKLFNAEGQPGTSAKVLIDNREQVQYVEGTTGTGCCADAPKMILDALQHHNESTINMQLTTVAPPLTVQQLKGLGIKEIVGRFTTHEACCDNRQYNIHHIADLSRGYLVMPGATFSLNGLTGERRIDNGWKMAAGIEGNGAHKMQPGGGTSQYTTTLFNAVYYAGLPLQGRAHSVHFSRYPFGQEATLSYPHPDLIFQNNTPYAILIWNYYDNESVTVELWSTKYAVGQTESITQVPYQLCIDWVNTRVVTFPDGHKEHNTYAGRYYPDGFADCIGTPAQKYDQNGDPITTTTTTTTTTLPGTPTTAPTVTTKAP